MCSYSYRVAMQWTMKTLKSLNPKRRHLPKPFLTPHGAVPWDRPGSICICMCSGCPMFSYCCHTLSYSCFMCPYRVCMCFYGCCVCVPSVVLRVPIVVLYFILPFMNCYACVLLFVASPLLSRRHVRLSLFTPCSRTRAETWTRSDLFLSLSLCLFLSIVVLCFLVVV